MSEADACLAAVAALMRGHTDRKDEEAIVALFASAPEAVLDEVLGRLDLRDLFGDVDDRSSGPRHRSSLLDLLCRDRVQCLSIGVRAKLVHALSSGRTCDRDEHAIRDLFTRTIGRALTELKNAIDAGDDHRDLRQLVFSDIDDERIRAEILGHIERHSSGLESREIKVLSDIDDTCYANWKDTRYPKKTVYPGVRQLYLELDRGPFEEPQPMGDLTFVTARPNDRIGFVEKATHETLAALGVGPRTILTGSLRRLHSNRAIAARKLENFADYAKQLYPEYDFVFIGDSGQGDAAFGAAMLEAQPSRARGVQPRRRRDAVARSRAVGRAARALLRHVRRRAIAALDLGLIQRAGVDRVASSAFAELDAIDFGEHPGEADRRAELERDRALIPRTRTSAKRTLRTRRRSEPYVPSVEGNTFGISLMPGRHAELTPWPRSRRRRAERGDCDGRRPRGRLHAARGARCVSFRSRVRCRALVRDPALQPAGRSDRSPAIRSTIR